MCELPGVAEDYRSLQELHLTDTTDDFDLIYYRESSEAGLDLLIYGSYPSEFSTDGNRRGNYTRRTDTWLNNTEGYGFPNNSFQTEPVWDPDIDDDGLTDSQEKNAITTAGYKPAGKVTGEGWHVRRSGRPNDFDTSPTDADSDGDGYWDGWVGVYNVSYSRNVILYPENLKDGNGIEAGERVDEQVGTHRIAEAPTPTDRYANISGEKRHSNLHLGELHWETNPADDSDAAYDQTTLTFEVDYHAQADLTALDILNSSDGRLNRTYKLYGMDISYNVDEEITDPDYADVDDVSEADSIENQYHDEDDATAYFFITRGYAGGNPAFASSNGNDYAGLDFGAFLFTGEFNNQTKPYYAHTSTHEVGHLLGAGRLDDKTFDTAFPNIRGAEVYSGGDNDTTPEDVALEGQTVKEWSTMAGLDDNIYREPMDGRYIVFSIEEVLKLEFMDIDSKADNTEPPGV